MSSIDKGVEQVVNRMGRNVRVVKRGNVIYGYMNGEQVFSLADRYGYINDREEAIIRDGIRRYDEEERRRQERREAERRAREEAIRRAREEEERRRREMLEAERRQAIANLKRAAEEKRREINGAISRRQEAVRAIESAAEKRRKGIEGMSRRASGLDFSTLLQRSAQTANRQRTAAEGETQKFRATTSQLDALTAQIKDNMTTEQANELLRRCRKVTLPALSGEDAGYENGKFAEELSQIENGLNELLPAIGRLQEAGGANDETGIIAREAINSISLQTIGGAEDLAAVSATAEKRLSKIVEVMENNRTAEAVGKLSYLHGAVSACKKTQTMVAKSTYTANDFRGEIVQKATTALAGFRKLAEGEFSTCSKTRYAQATERLEGILLQDGVGEDVLREVEKLSAELSAYEEDVRLHAGEYEEYKALKERLIGYGLEEREIPAFDVKGYARQKQEFSARLAYEKREYEKSQLIMTDMHARSAMEQMGYEQFASVGDAEGYVREALFTKAGYDGVLWQVISYANGSVSRRVIGVNKGETQTDKEYVKQVAAEMDEKGDQQRFLQLFKEETGSELRVTEAVEHDSENADEAIENNGFHYLQGEALQLYEKRVQKIVQNKPVKAKQTQVRVMAGDAVASSARSLSRAAQKSRAMCHEN